MSESLKPCRLSIRKDDTGYWLSIEGSPSALIALDRVHGPIVTRALDNAIAHGTMVDLAALALIERLANRRASPASPAIVEAERVVIAAAERLRLTSTEEGCGNSDINILRRAVDALAALRQQDAAKESHD